MPIYVDPLIVFGGDEAPYCFRHKPSCHMYADSLEELHKHHQKSTFIKLVVSVIASIIILCLLQPYWMFDLNTNKETNKIERSINFYISFFVFILLSIVIYFIL